MAQGDDGERCGASPLPAAAECCPGLRERKKAGRRQRISDAATRLFVAEGFEAVTLARIAAEADVAVKTILNHFATKEELFWDRVPAMHAELARLVGDRPVGTTAAAALREDARARWAAYPGAELARLDDPDVVAGLRAFHACASASPALAARARSDGEALGDLLAVVLDARSGGPSPRARAGGALLAAARRAVDRELTRALADATPGPAVRRRVRTSAATVFDAVEPALHHLGVGGPRAGVPTVPPATPAPGPDGSAVDAGLART